MPSLSDPGNTAFEGPATYRIVVQGELSELSRHRFADMTIKNDPAATDGPRTILRGQVRDQAELRGVLDALYGLHLAIINVKQCRKLSRPASVSDPKLSPESRMNFRCNGLPGTCAGATAPLLGELQKSQ